MKELKANILQGKYEDILAAVQSPVITLTELIKNAADSCLNNVEPIIVSISDKDKTIEIKDTGIGICEKEIEHLGEAGYSSKMAGDNISSPIDNPFSGSKGLGLLTAFFISEEIDMRTYSKEDRKAYHIVWKKGEQKYTYEEIEGDFIGTTVLLKSVNPEKLKLILLQDEKIKLFMTSLRFFTNDSKLPKIQLIIDGKEENYYPTETLENFYNSNKSDDKGFVAKASFNYSDNVISLSYQDNVSGFYTFKDKVIELDNKESVDKFIKDIKLPEKGPASIKKICESELFNSENVSINLPAFSGVFYTWRNQKSEELEQWPAGIRVFVNNYSLYRYLDKDNDWINFSEISQNVKATNYKLKNTYGYIDINYYVEDNEELKISKERNDFVDSVAQRKFIKIMREIIAVVFSRIDIAVKNPPIQSLNVTDNVITARLNEKINLNRYIIYNNISLDDIQVSYNKSELTIDKDWNVQAFKAGTYKVELVFGEESCVIELIFKEKIPEFALTKETIEIYRGNSVNLREYIYQNSCKDLLPENIVIRPQSSQTVVKNELFDKDNVKGRHVVLYKYGDFQKTLIVNVKEIVRQPGAGEKSSRIDSLFPKLAQLRDKSYRIPELIDAISSYYTVAPTLCMAAIRILIEASCRTFFQYMKDEKNDFSFPSLVNRTLSLQDCVEEAPDYKNYVAIQAPDFINEFIIISEEYKTKLSKDVKKNIKNHVETIDLDMFVHNPQTVASDTRVFLTMQVFAPMLNYIYDILLIDKK